MVLKPMIIDLTLNVPEKLQLYGLYVYYVVHICDFGMLRVNLHGYSGSMYFICKSACKRKCLGKMC